MTLWPAVQTAAQRLQHDGRLAREQPILLALLHRATA